MTFLLGIAILFVYTLYVVLRYGIQPSFSDSYYKTGILFQITMLLITVLFLIPMLEVTHGQWWQFISFLTIAPIGFVGAAAAFLDGGLVKRVHMTAAWLSATLSLIWVAFAAIYLNVWVIVTILLSSAIMWLFWQFDGKQNKIWWAEFACFGWTITSIAMLLYL